MRNVNVWFARCALSLFALAGSLSLAQERTGTVRVQVSPNRDDWTYRTGESVEFSVLVLRDGRPVPGASVRYELGPETLPAAEKKTIAVPEQGLTIKAAGLKDPGFLRLVAYAEVDGKIYRGLATAGFDPEKIRPSVEEPKDFDDFWNLGKAALAKLPIDARLTPMPELSTATVNVYHVNLQNIGAEITGTSRLYGILAEPKAEGKYPALLSVPGAGVRPYRGVVDLAEKGLITFQIGIHGMPVNLETSVYDSLRAAGLSGYQFFNLDNKERYYYRRVYLGALRANDFLTSLPKWDGKNLVVWGGSQGGALSIVTAALDERVKGLSAAYPALSDTTGYMFGRAGGWPHMFRSDSKESGHRTPEKLRTMQYYDVVNFARRLRVPGFYTWGFNDETCPPTSTFASYNVITAPKKLLLALETGHTQTPEQLDRIARWLETFAKTGQAGF
jgi:cephalosporin-C deacetylase